MTDSRIETNVSAVTEEFRAFIQELREKDRQRAAEIAELDRSHDATMKEFQKSFQRMDSMIAKIDGIDRDVQRIVNIFMVSVAAAVIGVATVAATTVYSVVTR